MAYKDKSIPHVRQTPVNPATDYKCSAITSTLPHRPCNRKATTRRNGYCKLHLQIAAQKASGTYDPHVSTYNKAQPDPSRTDQISGGITKALRKEAAAVAATGKLTPSQANNVYVTERAKQALEKLGQSTDLNSLDPKLVLLDMVHTAHQQVLLWKAMLMATPDEDWANLGMPPIPGLKATAGGARIEVVQKHLEAAIKNAAKISATAITAGLSERMVRLAEEQSALIADTVRAATIAAIGSLKLTPQAEAAAIDAAMGAAANHLRALSIGGATVVDGVAVAVD